MALGVTELSVRNFYTLGQARVCGPIQQEAVSNKPLSPLLLKNKGAKSLVGAGGMR